MLGKDELDKMFSEGLSEVQSFQNKEKQWTEVSARLKREHRPLFFWILPFIVLGLYGIALFLNSDPSFSPESNTYKSSNTNSLQKTTNESIESGQVNYNTSNYIQSSNSQMEEGNNMETNTINELEADQNSNNDSGSATKKRTDSNSKQLNPYSKKSNDSKNYTNTNIIKASKNTYYTTDNQTFVNSKSKNEEGDNEYSSSILSSLAHSDENKITSYPEAIENNLRIENIPEIRQFISTGLIHKNLLSPKKISILQKSDKWFGISIGTGLFTEIMQVDSITDMNHIGWTSNMSIRLSKFYIKLGYRKQNLDRSIYSDLSRYNIPDSSFVYGYGEPNSASLNYTNHLFDLSLGYNLLSYGKFQAGVHAGIQARKINAGNIDYSYQVYGEPFILEGDIPSGSLELSDMRLGTTIEMELYRFVGINFAYNSILTLDNKQFKWPNRHQFELGLILHIK